MYWRLSFLVSWFQSSLVSKCLGFLVSTFQSFYDPVLPKVYCMFSGTYHVFKIFKNVLDGSSRFVAPPLFFPKQSKLSINKILRLPNIIFSKKCFDFLWIILRALLSPKIKRIGFGRHGYVRKSRNHENYEFSVFPIMKSKS